MAIVTRFKPWYWLVDDSGVRYGKPYRSLKAARDAMAEYYQVCSDRREFAPELHIEGWDSTFGGKAPVPGEPTIVLVFNSSAFQLKRRW